MGLAARVWTSLQYCLYGDSEGFSVVNNACLMKKDLQHFCPYQRSNVLPFE